jgi:hypothetical protein
MIDLSRLIKTAYDLAGRRVPYVHQGRSLLGMDCLNFLIYLLEEQHYTKVTLKPYPMTPNGRHMAKTLSMFLDAVPVDEARTGDVYQILVGRNPQHLALRTSDTNPVLIVHADRAAGCVVESALDESMYPRIYAAWRFRESIPDEINA